MEGDRASLHFSLLNVDFVATKNDRDVFTDTLEIAVPVGDVLVRDSGSNVEHDDSTLPLDIVSISEATELFLASCIPDVEAYSAKVGGEGQRVDLDTEGGDVLLFEFTSQVAFDKGGLASTSITDKNELKSRDSAFSHGR